MTPERAAELAAMTTQCNAQGDALITVQRAILHACAEQRKEYADLMDEAAEDVAEWGAYASEYFQEKWGFGSTLKKWQDRAAAIRGQT